MKPLKQHPEREISPQTERNFWYAYAKEIQFGRGVLFINFWTDQTRLLPKFTREYGTTWWELESTAYKTMNITRFYWLRFGVAFVRPTFR